METNELKYFVSVAETENIHLSARKLGISASGISKAIARLEESLETTLFERVGRGIRLTQSGKSFVKEARALLAFQENVLAQFKKTGIRRSVVIGGEELVLAHLGPRLERAIKQKLTGANVQFKTVENQSVLLSAKSYDLDLGLFGSSRQPHGVRSRLLEKMVFRTYVSSKNPLSKRAHIHIEELRQHPFAVVSEGLLGLPDSEKTADGWRDDKFERPNAARGLSLKLAERLIEEGLRVGHFPEHYGRQMGWKALDVQGCPYQCTQQVYLIGREAISSELWSLV